MQELLHKLSQHRRRIRGARVVDQALRWGFYSSVLGCGALLVSKFWGMAPPIVLAASGLAAMPAAVAVRESIRSFSLRDCAVYLDRRLGLDERLATALEAPGPLSALLVSDASGALLRTPMPPRPFPREGKLLAASLAFLVVLGSLPAPGRSGAKLDPAMQSLSQAEAAKLASLADMEVEFKELTLESAQELKKGEPEAALALLEDLKSRLAEKLLDGTSDLSTGSRALLDQVTSSAAAVSAELARLGRRTHAPPAVLAQAKLRRQRALEQRNALPELPKGVALASATAASDNIPWNPRYDSIIRRYFGREP